MTVIKNLKFLSAQRLLDLLKLSLDVTLLPSLMLAWLLTTRIDEVISIAFQEIIEGTVFTISVKNDAIELISHRENSGYDTSVMHQYLCELINEQTTN